MSGTYLRSAGVCCRRISRVWSSAWGRWRRRSLADNTRRKQNSKRGHIAQCGPSFCLACARFPPDCEARALQQGPFPGSAGLDAHQGVLAAGVEEETGGPRVAASYGGDADAVIAQDGQVVNVKLTKR